MNSGAKMLAFGRLGFAALALCLMVAPASAQEDTLVPVQGGVVSKSVSEAILPNPAQVADAAKAASAGLAGEASTSAQPTAAQIATAAQEAQSQSSASASSPEAARVNAIEVLARLKAGGSSKPLTLAELAAVNDALKRLEYLSQMESKISELHLSGATGGVVIPAQHEDPSMSGMPSPVSSGAVGEYQILQISGSQGVYKALLGSAGQTVYVRAGDTLPIGTVAGISLNGVKVSTASGIVSLPFKSQSAGLLR